MVTAAVAGPSPRAPLSPTAIWTWNRLSQPMERQEVKLRRGFAAWTDEQRAW